MRIAHRKHYGYPFIKCWQCGEWHCVPMVCHRIDEWSLILLIENDTPNGLHVLHFIITCSVETLLERYSQDNLYSANTHITLHSNQ